MTFDEFLLSEKISCSFGDKNILKIPYNEDIYFIYKPTYNRLEYNEKLENIGIFEKQNQKLYGSSWEFDTRFNKELESKFYKGSFEKINEELSRDSNLLLNNYITENASLLKANSIEVWEKYIASEYNLNSIKNNAKNKYIYGIERDNIVFSINKYKYERDKTLKILLMEYLEKPKEIAEKVFREYINNDELDRVYSRVAGIPDYDVTIKEKIGIRLWEYELENKLINDYENNFDNEVKLEHDIINAIKDLDVQTLTLNLERNGKEISFKYPKDQLYNLYFSDYYIASRDDRKAVKEFYADDENKSYSYDFKLEDIKSITFRKQIIFEQKELENDKDITDEMFE